MKRDGGESEVDKGVDEGGEVADSEGCFNRTEGSGTDRGEEGRQGVYKRRHSGERRAYRDVT